MKKLIVISDSFKGTISSREICAIARKSVSRILPGCEVDAIPVADGGEGTVECFADAIGAKHVSVLVGGPYGEAVEAIYARRDSSAIVEMASAAGLPMVGDRKDPSATTTFGVGALILCRLRRRERGILSPDAGGCAPANRCRKAKLTASAHSGDVVYKNFL